MVARPKVDSIGFEALANFKNPRSNCVGMLPLTAISMRKPNEIFEFMACAAGDIISADKFPQLFADQTPVFDKRIIHDIIVSSGWIGNVGTTTVPIGTPNEITQTRLRGVYPNTTRPWDRVQDSSCVGRPCDPAETQIGWGADRRTFYKERQVWSTPLLCYDQDRTVTEIEEHLEQMIVDILRPATETIFGSFIRKRHLQWANTKWQANKTMDRFTFTWSQDADGNEVFFDCSVSPNNVFMLSPQALQAQFQPLMNVGYGGKNPFRDAASFIELVTDTDTLWNLEKLGGQQGFGGGNTPTAVGNWRFTQFDEASKYWRYGFSGQIGNFMTRIDNEQLRFNFVQDLGSGAAPNRYRYQLIQPFYNETTSGSGGSPGLGRVYNLDYQRAHFRISQIHHKLGLELLVPDAGQLNPEMPFAHRNFGGKWQWLNHDLGADENGCVISNKWGNKGQFGGWFEYYVRPHYTELIQDIFHKGEPMCVPEINTCSDDPGYPTQTYNSANDPCPADEVVLTFTPVKNHLSGEYEIAANTVLCNGDNVDNVAINGVTTLAALVVLLNADFGTSAMGTWAVSASDITLTGTTCSSAVVPFLS